jgi:hypothetical protein
MKRAFDYVSRELAKTYLVLLGIAILVAFPVMSFFGLFYLMTMIGDSMGLRGAIFIVYVYGSFVALLTIYAVVGRHVWPVIQRVVDELHQSVQDLE